MQAPPIDRRTGRWGPLFRLSRAAVGLTIVLSAWGAPAAAQHLYVDPRAEIRLTVTDNANLTETDRVADGSLNTAIGLNARFEGNRWRGALDYSLDHFLFFSDGFTETRQNMFGTIDGEVIEDHFNVIGRASLRQQFLSQRGALSGSDANRTANRRLVEAYTGTGILRGGWRDFADWRATYRVGVTRSPADNLEDETLPINFSDSTSHEFTATIGSGERFRSFEWRLFADSSRVLRSLDVNDFRKERAGGDITYKFSRFFQVNGGINVSSNDFQSEELSEEGFGWEAGFRWTPGRKLDMSLSFGKEGNRDVWYGSLQHFFSARFDFIGSYTDTITANTIVGNDTLNSLSFNADEGIVNTEQLPVDETDPNFSFTDVDFRRRALVGTFTLRHKRTSSYVSGNYEWRTFDDSSGTARGWGVSYGMDHEIDRKTSLIARLSYRQSLFEDGVRVDDFIVGSLSWTRTVSDTFRFAVSYDHSTRLSNEEGQDLRENALSVYLRGKF